jgi:hypothetical protein
MDKSGVSGVVDYIKGQGLLTMYASVERMNQHIFDNDNDGVVFERHLQMNLRSKFQDFQRRTK